MHPIPNGLAVPFTNCACANDLSPHLAGALGSTDWRSRQRHLVAAYEELARRHNWLGLTAPMPEKATTFFGRPFAVMAFHGFAEALFAEISDPAVRRIASQPPIGSIDQFSDSTDLLSNGSWRLLLRRLYKNETREYNRHDGNQALGLPAFRTRLQQQTGA